jgi:UPF0176 protein
MKPYIVISFYKFTVIDVYETLKQPLLKAMNTLDIKGTIILAKEGINGSVCGDRHAIVEFISQLTGYSFLTDLTFRETVDDNNPFTKAKVKLRKEIVTMGDISVDPTQLTGIHVTPDKWNALITDPNVVVIDTRNNYEVALGTFQGAISPQTDNFREFPDYVRMQLLDKKDRKIAMFCTGGIRCEKSTAYLRQLGFKHVYQLNGGILNYLESIPADKSKWQGSCFVFDERVAVDATLKPLKKGSIDKEWKNNNKKKQPNIGAEGKITTLMS